MKKQLLSLALLLTGVAGWGQTIPNNGFETWESIQGYYPEPTEWSTLNFYSLYNLPGGASQSSDAAQGQSSAKIESFIGDADGDGDNDTLAGVLFSGVFDPFNNIAQLGIATNLRPDSLTGYFKFSTVQGDNWLARVLVTRWDETVDSSVVIARTDYFGGEASSFTRFSFPIDYLLPDTPDTIAILLANSDPILATAGAGVLYVDEIAFANESGVSIGENETTLFQLSPNPASSLLSITSDLTGVFTLYDAQGKRIRDITKATTAPHSIDVNDLESGIYWLGYGNSRSKFIVSH